MPTNEDLAVKFLSWKMGAVAPIAASDSEVAEHTLPYVYVVHVGSDGRNHLLAELPAHLQPAAPDAAPALLLSALQIPSPGTLRFLGASRKLSADELDRLPLATLGGRDEGPIRTETNQREPEQNQQGPLDLAAGNS